MAREVNLKSVCDYLNEENDENTLQLTSNILGVAIISAPIFFGPAAFFALSLLTAKNELISTGKKLIKKIISKKHEEDSLERLTKLEMAYGLIFYTAFFDSIDKVMPSDIRIFIDKVLKNKKNESTFKEENRKKFHEEQQRIELVGAFVDTIPLPHPAIDFETTKEQLLEIYTRMAREFGVFVKKICLHEGNEDNIQDSLNVFVEKIPKLSLKRFDAQYIYLSSIFEDFKIWVLLKEREYLKKENSDFLRKFGEFQLDQKKSIDVGLEQLQVIVQSMPYVEGKIKAKNVIEGLQNYYQSIIKESIVEDREVSYDDKPSLKFPKISEAFIPQSYSVLRYDSSEIRLEQEKTWGNLTVYNNITTFILRFLNLPVCIDHPLLILGHPGSGKSLLTKILCARLIGNIYTPIRIPLREVNAELQIETLIEKQVEKDSGHKIDSWADFANQFRESPLLIILDGYDELLQASGKVFAGFLDKIQKFQQSQQVQNRPVRIIVTSRITLIDKATVPDGCTILRLLEFDQYKRDAWIEIWNKTNDNYFSASNSVKQFALPREPKNGKKDKVLDLAEQPLLLLMLALYDSEANSLSRTKRIDRTVLYDSLLRRFVRRERRRYVDDFDHLPLAEQNKILDFEMKRLGVAAIGMYNRRKLHILSSELIDDLHFFSSDREVDEGAGHILSQADFLLGSFFFIHKSSAKKADADNKASDTAFEFLHNTFGEFLTADFILKYSLEQTDILQTFSENAGLIQEYHKRLNDPDGFPDDWFACLMFSPLYTRPVIPEMLREWVTHVLAKRKKGIDEFIKFFDCIVESQLSIILNRRSFPKIMRIDAVSKFADLPILGLIANYTMNLIILRAIYSGSFVFDEIEFKAKYYNRDQSDQSTGPWDRLIHIWRAWFKIENLSGLSAILSSKRNGGKIEIKCNKDFTTNLCNNQLSHIVSATDSIADDLTFGLASLHSSDCRDDDEKWLENVNQSLLSAHVDIAFELLVRQLRHKISGLDVKVGVVDELIVECLGLINTEDVPKFLIVSFFDLLTLAIQRGYVDIRGNKKFPGIIFELLFDYFRTSNLKTLSNRISWLALELDDEIFIDGIFNGTVNLHGELLARRGFVRQKRFMDDVGIYRSKIIWKSKLTDYLFDMIDRNVSAPDSFVGSKLMEKWLVKVRKAGYLRLPKGYIEHIFESITYRLSTDFIQHYPGLANEYLKLAHDNRFIESAESYIKLFLENSVSCLDKIIRVMDYDHLPGFIAIVRVYGDDRMKASFSFYLLKKTQRLGGLMLTILSCPQAVVEYARMVKGFDDKNINKLLDKFLDLIVRNKEVLTLVNASQLVAMSVISLLRRQGHLDVGEFVYAEALNGLDLSLVPTDFIDDLVWYVRLTNNLTILSRLKDLIHISIEDNN